MIESDSRPWMCQAGLSKDQQKGEKFNKGHFVVTFKYDKTKTNVKLFQGDR